MKKLLATAALLTATLVGSPAFADETFIRAHHDDCFSIAVAIGVQKFGLSHGDENALGIAGREIIALVHAIGGEPTEVISACNRGGWNARSVWSLAQSYAGQLRAAD